MMSAPFFSSLVANQILCPNAVPSESSEFMKTTSRNTPYTKVH